jgi:hypothetical protein
MQRLERKDFQKQEVQSALDEIGWLAHELLSVNEMSVQQFLSVSKAKVSYGQIWHTGNRKL